MSAEKDTLGCPILTVDFSVWKEQMVNHLGYHELLEYVQPLDLGEEEVYEEGADAAAMAAAKVAAAVAVEMSKGRLGKDWKAVKEVKAMSIIKKTLQPEHLYMPLRILQDSAATVGGHRIDETTRGCPIFKKEPQRFKEFREASSKREDSSSSSEDESQKRFEASQVQQAWKRG